MNFLITICARGGSKGIPGKNIKPVNGIPLIGYSIKVAQQFCELYKTADIALSTDSEEILDVCRKLGLHTKYRRPLELGGDTVGKIDVLKDVLAWHENFLSKNYDYVLDLDVTAPLRNIDDLSAAYKIIEANKDAVNLFSVSAPHRNPYFNMVEEKKDGFYDLVKRGDGVTLTRQTAPKVYDMNASFYFYRKIFFEKGYKSAVTDRSIIYEVPHICFDLDHPIDYEFLSFLIMNNKLGFTL